ncbi:Si-specific NAD(P)(+) transhydrogenase [Desulfurispira natronophila]|uniref:Soluble pyridine nucleotide transhydrogenase n=1 Tax=Desulfurispira natronophila TaxID=682562 RepID=A0A7W7Y3W9_9BACT|nr:Si-specific NAD(P)(+) transhydrogenase [Desulfurispira natronophila]MBB5021641.1 NAD(P) transhydrogenase [Desulfurispira natronophila]
MSYQYDLIVIGSGPAGLNAALEAIKQDKRVLVIEERGFEGGNYLHNGTIPSKTLREAVLRLTGKGSALASASLTTQQQCQAEKSLDPCQEITFADLEREVLSVIGYQLHSLQTNLSHMGIDTLSGAARFINAHTLEVRDQKQRRAVTGDIILVATGSRPRTPSNVPIDNEVIFESTGLLRAGRIPKKMIVVGGGVIGTEYATIFAALGTQVQLLDRNERPLQFLDDEVCQLLTEIMAENGVEFVPGQNITAIRREGDEGVVQTDTGAYHADLVLYALGRTANTETLDLANANLSLNDWGYIPVNNLYQTATPNIFAVGDVIGWPSLASTSALQGQMAVRHAFRIPTSPFPELFPFGVYTIPEISMVGKTSQECEAKGYQHASGRARFGQMPRGIISNDLQGMVKLNFHQETGELLGVHIIGTSATEIIHTGYLAIMGRKRVDEFPAMVFNTPTFSEGYRIAALDGMCNLKNR